MRNLVIAFLVSAPIVASAQTPADIARQVWPFGAVSHTGISMADRPADAGAATGRDLARLLWPSGSPKPTGVAPENGTAYAQSFAPADLVRLRGSSASGQMAIQEAGSYRIAVTGRPAQ